MYKRKNNDFLLKIKEYIEKRPIHQIWSFFYSNSINQIKQTKTKVELTSDTAHLLNY